MAEVSGEQAGQTNSITTVSIASLVGTTVEWYDFFIYGTAAALVLNQLFFPSFDSLTGTLLALSTFTIGFFARPIGGTVAGHYGDTVGRKTLLVITVMVMGIATFCIGLLPTYETIGIWAPILLIFFRLCQGFGVGGEWGGAVLMTVEHAPSNRRGFYGSWPQMGVPLALILATASFAAVTALPEEQFVAWGWRLPFLASIILTLLGLFIRFRLMETPAFDRVKEAGATVKLPVLEVIRRHPKELLLMVGARFAETGPYYIYSVFVIAYVTGQLGLPESVPLTGVLIGAAIALPALAAFAALSDRIGRRPVYMAGALFTGLFAFPLFWLLNTEVPALIVVALVLGLVLGWAPVYGPQAAFFSELFGTGVRYSGLGFGYQVGVVVAGGFTPTIATALLAWSGGNSWSVALYLVAMSLITVVSTYFLAETYKKNISLEEPKKVHQ